MATFIYPTAAELRQTEREKLPVLEQADPIFSILPVEEVDDDLLIWDTEGNLTGLQQYRGLDGAPSRVKAIGANEYLMRPGYYGEFAVITETELTRKRRLGTFGEVINVSDLVMKKQDHLLNRRIDRIRYIGWTLLTTGTFAVANYPQALTAHTDTYSLQTQSGSAWGTPASGTPIADLRATKLLARGKSIMFNRKSKAYMNQVTANKLLANTNAADLGGKKLAGLSQPIGMADINSVFLAEDLPTVEVYDEGYLRESDGVFVPFIADNKTVIVGARTNGAALGNYRMTRNATNPDLAPGAYSFVKDEQGPPRNLAVHDGHNGGPVIYYPSAIVILTTT